MLLQSTLRKSNRSIPVMADVVHPSGIALYYGLRQNR